MCQHLKCFHIWHSSIVCRGIEVNGWLSNNLFWHQNTSNQRELFLLMGPTADAPPCVSQSWPSFLKTQTSSNPLTFGDLKPDMFWCGGLMLTSRLCNWEISQVIHFPRFGGIFYFGNWVMPEESNARLRTNGNPSSQNESANTIWEFSRDAKERLKLAKLSKFERMV